MSFGAETSEDAVPVSLVALPDTLRNGDTEVAMPTVWPEEVITIAALPEVDLLPAPAANNFRYNRIIRSRAKKEKRRPSREITHSVNADVTGSIPDRGKREPKAKTAKSNTKADKTAKSNTNTQGRHQYESHSDRTSRASPAARIGRVPPFPAGTKSRSPGRRRASHRAADCRSHR